MSVTTSRPVNLYQLQSELGVTALGATYAGSTSTIFTYDAQGQPVDLPPVAQAVVDAHVAMRDKTDAEYAAEFQDGTTTPQRKQDIRDQQSGLLPREQVQITQQEWDEEHAPSQLRGI